MTVTAGFLAERNVHGVGAAAVRSHWTYRPNRGTRDRTASACRSPRQSRGSGGSVRALTLSLFRLRDPSSARLRRGRGRCRTHGRADAPTGPCKTAPTRFRTSAHRRHLFPDHQTGSDRPGERSPDFYASTWLPTEGVEPTNNLAERARRHAVQWRKTSFGNRSEDGERAVARLLTITRTCQLQQLNVLAYLTAAIRSHRHRQAAASLLPQRSTP